MSRICLRISLSSTSHKIKPQSVIGKIQIYNMHAVSLRYLAHGLSIYTYTYTYTYIYIYIYIYIYTYINTTDCLAVVKKR